MAGSSVDGSSRVSWKLTTKDFGQRILVVFNNLTRSLVANIWVGVSEDALFIGSGIEKLTSRALIPACGDMVWLMSEALLSQHEAEKKVALFN
jgi:hypothetical protein